ncbi:probable JmjC domain-containing histone demethylation protein 2C isoform X3 [Anoplophora glabripennis]|uniref:probable JmjC domain-containing histone demethylation protein 2C isoform X3 n=1 Tax=Anoplophora glabripennis TaxID=217634 RepID=UPI000C779BBB|nr:probable JmjC domain-containing histone demethylation protein 2C isoform X3 [Anoplophora glabripennis]
MAYKCREEVVGKRFLSVSGFSKLKSGKISEWGWRSGVVRAATHRDNTNQDLQVLVEYDDVEWHRREWISVYKEGLFQMFMVEQALVWAQRRDPFTPTHGTALWPALTFSAIVSTVDIPTHLQPVEFLVDRELAFKDYKLLEPYQEWDSSLPGVKDYPELRLAVKRWTELQDGQRILLTTPSVLVGYRVEVYRAEGTTQWYTAVIIGYNEATRDLTVTDDTVLEEHNEDPALVQMRLIGDGVVESIMRGENVGITPRRSRSSVFLHQTSQTIHQNRVIRGLSSVTTCSVNPRKPRSARSGISDAGNSPEPPDKGSAGKSRKRKPSETDAPSTAKSRISSFAGPKEDCENKQTRTRKNLNQRGSNKKKVLEEANNSKLREIEVRVEDCLQSNPALSELCRRKLEESGAEEEEEEDERPEHHEEPPADGPDPRPIEPAEDSNGSSVELVSVVVRSDDATVQCGSMPASQVVNGGLNGEEDCVIVAQRTSTPSKAEERDCSIRGDDDGPLVSSSPYSRMELNSETPTSLLRFPDDRSDSGVSSLRSGSGDERSGSRSSALSSSDEPNHTSSSSSSSSGPAVQAIPAQNRSPLFIPAPSSSSASAAQQQQRHDTEPVRVWRDPNLLLEEPHVRHIQSVQHQTLLMSHPSTPASSGPSAPTSATGTHPASLGTYPVVPPPPTLMSPHPLGHPHLAAQHLYHHPQFSDMLWKSQRGPYGVSAHLLPQQTGHSTSEDILDRERVFVLQDRERHERMIRWVEMERQNQELEKQQKEKERLERDRQEQREKLERERERERQEKERELEKERQEQALHNHFEKSLRAAQQKVLREQWNPIAGRPPQPRTSSLSEDDRKRAEELHQREQQRHLTTVRQDARDHRSYYPRPQSVPGKTEYPPPPAHSRVVAAPKQPTEKISSMVPQSMPKSELNMYGYPVCHPQNSFFEPKKSDLHKTSPSGLVVSKSGTMDREREMTGQSLVSEIKNSVIVKHDAKNPHHLESRVTMAHSPSPKLRNEILSHYLPTPTQGGQAKGMYEYRSPTQSPLHLTHHLEAQNLGKAQSHHRPTGQMSSPHHQRQSPHQHPHSQPHPSPEMRFPRGSEAQTMIYQTSGKTSYPFTTAAYTMSTTPSVSNSKPKVSSPAPPQIFGKPPLGGVSVVPVSRPHETSAPIQLTAKPPLSSSVSPSPYQQVSQYHPPHNQAPPMMTCPPPPAHSSRTTSSLDRYDRTPGYVPGGLSVKLVGQQGTSPPSAASAPLPISRSHAQFLLNLSGVSQQTQPLDLGVSSNKMENSSSVSPKRKAATPVSNASTSNPVCLEVKKRRIEPPPASAAVPPNLSIFGSVSQQPQLARVSEPSPLIASAATTITTVVNTAAYRTPTSNVTSLISQTPMILTENLPDVSVTAVTVETIRPASTGELSPKPPTPTVPLSNSPAPVSAASTPTPPTSVTPGPAADESPGTPVKVNITPSTVDSEKSNSPGPQKTSSSSYPVRHLKKAWLQRHTGEDMEDTTGVVGSGSCVTLPINIKVTAPAILNNTSNPVKENPVNSIHAVGTMAINSINKTKHFPSKPVNRKPVKECTVNGDAKNDDSSSSDQERGRKSPPKRKPPKVKRKKGGGGSSAKKPNDDKKRKTGPQPPVTPPSESGSDSEKESGSEKDSDSGASASAPGKKNANAGKEPRKRGRRPKGSKNDKGEEPRPKKIKDDIQPPRDPFRKPPVGQLKKTGESFLQDGPCFEVAPKLAKCRECRWTPNQRSKNMPNIFCRFYAFRRLRYTKNGQLAIAGFSDPHKDALEDDLKLWLPNPETPPPDLDLETSRFLLKQVGDHFCDLLVQEKDAHSEHMSEDKTVAWKRVVQGVREMCDVCETTLFNFHWACNKCGFVVCIDCYKSRKKGAIKVWGEPGKDRDEYSWLLCTNRQAHEQEKLMLTQIIAGESLMKLGKMVHEMRELWNIEQYCACPTSKEVTLKPNNVQAKEIIKGILGDKVNGIKKEIKDEDDVPLDREEKKEGSSSEEEGNFSTLRELLIRPSHKPNGSRAASPVSKTESKKKTSIPTKPADLDDVISSVIEDSVPQKTVETPIEPKYELKHFVRRYNWQGKGRVQLPIRIMTLTESKMLYPDTPHSWLCDGKLLRLSDPLCKENQKIFQVFFQDQWKRGQPVIVSDVTRNINPDLWNPEAFARDFGDEKNDLVNCMTGNLVPNQPMRKFWEGFDHFSKRLKDDRGQPMLLKLKDWPPGEDFAEMLPSRYSDLMKVLPLSEYTHRTGRLNLASRLPDCFVRPDLGPKMYNAYGSALHPNKGTTNLHLDISDAVNVMVYVGIPKDGDSDEHIKEAFRAIDEAGCDILTRRRVRDKGELPGALWHIYNARDADKIRDLLNKVVVEKGGRLEPHHDPIHDQSCYLDGPLRERLYKEYGVEGYAIVQCKGDAVFIPAGAPHQVRNLHNCIKVAEDFVSPENVSHCFHLTQEFRDLSDTHSNHEDKLQIKNIIYHAVKDSLSTLSAIMNKHLNVKSEKDSGSERSNGSAAVDAENSTKSDSNETA